MVPIPDPRRTRSAASTGFVSVTFSSAYSAYHPLSLMRRNNPRLAQRRFFGGISKSGIVGENQ